MKYNLVERQKKTLRDIVKAIKDKKLNKLFVPCIYLDEFGEFCECDEKFGFGPELVSDLDTMAQEGLLTRSPNSKGNPSYSLRQAAYDAVDNDFEKPDAYPQAPIGVSIQNMSGGNVQGIGLAQEATIQQIVNDPEMLKAQVDAITQELVEAVRAEIQGDRLDGYEQYVEAFKEEMLKARPEPSKLLKTLSLMADVEGGIGFGIRILSCIVQLAMLAEGLLKG